MLIWSCQQKLTYLTMKKFFIISVLCFFSTFSYSQESLTRTIEAEVVYVDKYYLIFHHSLDCSSLKNRNKDNLWRTDVYYAQSHYKECSKCKDLTSPTTTFAHITTENEFYKSAKYLKTSANYAVASFGTTVFTGAVVGVISNKADSKTIIAASAVGGAISLVLGGLSIDYLYKSGKSLSIAAGRITYNF